MSCNDAWWVVRGACTRFQCVSRFYVAQAPSFNASPNAPSSSTSISFQCVSECTTGRQHDLPRRDAKGVIYDNHARPGNSARDTGSIYLTPYKTYGGTIQVKVQGVLDWPNARVAGVPARHERRARGRAQRLHVVVFQLLALRREAVNHGCLHDACRCIGDWVSKRIGGVEVALCSGICVVPGESRGASALIHPITLLNVHRAVLWYIVPIIVFILHDRP